MYAIFSKNVHNYIYLMHTIIFFLRIDTIMYIQCTLFFKKNVHKR